MFVYVCFVFKETARTVTEEIEPAEDEDDEITFSKPTPRVSLHTGKDSTTSSKPDLREETLTERKAPKSHRDIKGKTSHAKELAHPAHELEATPKEKRIETKINTMSAEKNDTDEKDNIESNIKKVIDRTNADDLLEDDNSKMSYKEELSQPRFTRRSSRNANEGMGITSEHVTEKMKTSRSEKCNFIDDLFKSSVRSRSSYFASFAEEFQAHRNDSDHEKHTDQTEDIHSSRKNDVKNKVADKQAEEKTGKDGIKHTLSQQIGRIDCRDAVNI